jgi:hypothetical protein
MTLYDKWRKIYQQDSKSLSTKARKLWRGQSLPDDKVKSVKIKQHPRKQPKQPLSTTNKTPPIVPAQ